jgi:hypothetical protein
MPLSKDESGGGTDADGTKSTHYCRHCYVLGRFTEPDLNAEQTAEKVRAKIKQMHIPAFLAKSLTKDIPKLERWARRWGCPV